MFGSSFGLTAAWLLLSSQMPAAGPDPKLDVQLLEKASLQTDGDSLLAFFKKRTLADKDRDEVRKLIVRLGSLVYKEREQAMMDLIARGPVVTEMLREATKSDDLETSRRAEKCLARIQERDVAVDVPAAAARILARLKPPPPSTIETMLSYLPFADNDSVADEVRAVLAKLAVSDGKAHPVLVAGLTDKFAVRRAASGEALVRAAAKDEAKAVRKLLSDPDAFVRLRIALALVYTNDKDAVPVLIDTLPHLSVTQAWQAEDVLFRLGEGKEPPTVSLGMDEASRKKARDAWQGWWKEHGKAIDLAKLKETPPLLGYTLVVLLDNGKIMELGRDNQVRWQMENLMFPLDVQYLPGDRVLLAEYHGGRVTERNLKGEVVWEKKFTNPQVAQRLPNGNTYIASDTQVAEVGRDDKEIYSFSMTGGERIMKSAKLPNGQVVCLTDRARVVRFDTAGKEVHSFNVNIGMRLFGGRLYMQPSGRVLIPHYSENKVVEYDGAGKAVWEVMSDQPVAAVRLPNGNTMVTSMLPGRGATEYNRTGQEVWTYRANTRVTRALRR